MQGFTITQAEWEEIQAYLATQPADTVARIQNQQKTVPWVGAEDSGATVTYCQFRDMEKKNCSIYPVRPTICRIFGHTWWLPCPIGAVKHVPEGAETVWENYREFERLTIEEWAQKTGENK
jgi:Fe-S-cluster containining protein